MLVSEKQNHIGFSEYRTAPWGICKTPEIPDPVSVFQIMMNLIELNPQRNKEPLRKLKKAISLLMWLVCICSSVSVSGWWESRAPAQLVVFTHFYRTSFLVSSEDEVSLGSKMDWWKKLTPYRMYRTVYHTEEIKKTKTKRRTRAKKIVCTLQWWCYFGLIDRNILKLIYVDSLSHINWIIPYTIHGLR